MKPRSYTKYLFFLKNFLKKLGVIGNLFIRKGEEQNPSMFPCSVNYMEKKIKNVLVPVATTAAVYCVTTMPMIVFADELSNSLWNVADKILGVAQGILFPILAIMTVFFGIKIFIASDAKSVQEAKGNALRCGIGALIVLFAPTLVKTIKDAIDGSKITNFTR